MNALREYYMKIKSFYSPKGGVGKSTLALNYASYCKEVLDKNVLFVDLDPQKSCEIFCKKMGVSYLSELPKGKPEVDVLIIDYPPAATLEIAPLGDVVLIGSPSYLSVIGLIKAYENFNNPLIVINRFFGNRKDHREILGEVRELEGVKSAVLTLNEFQAIQRAENKITGVFSLSEADAKDIYNFDKAKLALSNIFNKF